MAGLRTKPVSNLDLQSLVGHVLCGGVAVGVVGMRDPLPSSKQYCSPDAPVVVLPSVPVGWCVWCL